MFIGRKLSNFLYNTFRHWLAKSEEDWPEFLFYQTRDLKYGQICYGVSEDFSSWHWQVFENRLALFVANWLARFVGTRLVGFRKRWSTSFARLNVWSLWPCPFQLSLRMDLQTPPPAIPQPGSLTRAWKNEQSMTNTVFSRFPVKCCGVPFLTPLSSPYAAWIFGLGYLHIAYYCCVDFTKLLSTKGY